MNPELMLALINNLTDRAACIQEERGVIRRASEDNSNGDTPLAWCQGVEATSRFHINLYNNQ